MTNKNNDKLMGLIRDKKHAINIQELKQQHESKLLEQHLEHKRQMAQTLELERERAKNEALQEVIRSGATRLSQNPESPLDQLSRPQSDNVPAPLLSVAIADFLAWYDGLNNPSMMQKHKTAMPLFLEVIGDKPTSEIRQADIVEFFDLLERLPSKWKVVKKQEGCGIRELAEKDHKQTISPKTFKENYKSPIRGFLVWAKVNLIDQGFPATLTVEGIIYTGEREPGENKQRAFKQEELVQLFEGPELRKYAANANTLHQYWLPMVGLYTGARVREICQLNPQTDFVKEDGIDCFWFTKETPSAPNIDKKIKNANSARKIPIHSKLIELGLLDYVSAQKQKGSLVLFPQWKVKQRKASFMAEEWFRKFLMSIGLKDQTLHAKISGMHAFRHTFLNRALNLNVDNASVITGHVDGSKSQVVRGYEGVLSVQNKRNILEKITFEIDHPVPVEVK